MANIYFTSPTLPKNVKVEAVAGSRKSLLKLAQENKVEIPCDCQDGECGTCVVKVIHLDGDRIKAVMLEEKEKEGLAKLGKLSSSDRQEIETTDIPPIYRLACQVIVTDEDLLVEFAG